MSAVQILRTVGLALVLGGLALGLFPMGEGGDCGSGWIAPSGMGCGGSMAPVGSWAVALIVIGATVLVSVWINTPYRPKNKPAGQGQQK